MTILMGCIADDFTGATDIAALLTRLGLSVAVINGVPPKDMVPGTEAVVIALKSRTIDPAMAVKLAEQACDYLVSRLAAQSIYFKYCSTFDSTDRGNIGPVIDALLARLGVAWTSACPAFPENDRRVFMGHLFVGTRLLSESALAEHPLTPMNDPDLVRVLSRQRQGPVSLVSRPMIEMGAPTLRKAIANGLDGTVFICDAVEDADLEILAEAFKATMFHTGGSAFGAALAAALVDDNDKPASKFDFPRQSSPRPIGLVGSASAMTRAQTACALGGRWTGYQVNAFELGDPQAAARGFLDAIENDKAERPLIHAVSDRQDIARAQTSLGLEEASVRIETFFAFAAKEAIARGFDSLVVAGGETSGAVVQQVVAEPLIVGVEIAPGVPWMRCGDLNLALKSGNFGAETFFDDALECLMQPRSH